MDKEWLEQEDVIQHENEMNSAETPTMEDPPDDWEPNLPPFDLPERSPTFEEQMDRQDQLDAMYKEYVDNCLACEVAFLPYDEWLEDM